MSRRRQLLAHRYTPWVAVILGVIAALFSLDTGLSTDDHLLQYAFQGGTQLPWSPLTAGPSEAIQVHAARDLGLLPWTASEHFSFAFLRPLSMATHALDFTLWPQHPWLMHGHSVAWFALFLAGGAVLIRRIHGPSWVTGLAIVLFALDDAHGPSVGWIANRNLVMAAAFGVWALVAHHRALHDDGPRWFAPLLFLAALASNEAAIGWWPLWLALTVIERRGWPVFTVITALCIVWVTTWTTLGYGVHGSGVYADLAAHPVNALGQLLTNLPVLATSLVTGTWATLFSVASGPVRTVWLVVSWAVFLGFSAICVRRVQADRRTLIWALGALGALLPVSASFPSDRLLLIASLPGAVLLATLIAHLRDDRRSSRIATAIAMLLVTRHIALNLVLAPLRARSMEAPADLIERSTDSLGPIGNAHVLLLNAPSDALPAYGVVLTAVRDEPLPTTLHSLYSGLSALTVERIDTHTLRLTPHTPWMAYPSERLSRDTATEPFLEGDTVSLPGFDVTVEAVTADGRPTVTRVHLHDPDAISWFAWDVTRFQPVTLPDVGETLTLVPTDAAAAYFGIEP